jgi:hypothetical protein
MTQANGLLKLSRTHRSTLLRSAGVASVGGAGFFLGGANPATLLPEVAKLFTGLAPWGVALTCASVATLLGVALTFAGLEAYLRYQRAQIDFAYLRARSMRKPASATVDPQVWADTLHQIDDMLRRSDSRLVTNTELEEKRQLRLSFRWPRRGP